MKINKPFLKRLAATASIVAALAVSAGVLHASGVKRDSLRSDRSVSVSPQAVAYALPAGAESADAELIKAKEAAAREDDKASAEADRWAALQSAAVGTVGARPIAGQLQLPAVTCGAGNVRVESTGGNADYPTLKEAFDAINAGTHTGAIDVGICGNTTETAPAVLNASGTGAASYTSVLITPTGARTVSGAILAGSPLIDLNGADNVTINGLNSGGNSLTIANTTASGTAGTSTIRLINGTENNTITNCTVLGSSTTTVTAAGGTILISTSSAGSNTNNTVSNNNIGPAGTSTPTKGVMLLGSASPNNNTLNLIDNNNVFDFFQPAVGVAGIVIQANSNMTTVSNNRLYQTAPRTFTATALTYAGITMTSSGNSATITGNVVGFGAANGTGTTTISGSTNVFVGLNLTSSSTTTPTSVQNNTISGINQSTASTSTSTTAPFRGIYLASGRYDVGNLMGNQIGSLDGSSTITFTQSATGAIYGIYDFSSSSNTISNNRIGAITINGTGTGTGGFRGIWSNTVTAASGTISNNQIGGDGAGAITNSLVGNYLMVGIRNETGSVTVRGNTIRNISGNSNGATAIVGSGIFVFGSNTSTPSLVSQNVIHSLSNNSGAAGNSIYALYCSFPAAANLANVVERNFVHSLSITSTNTAAQLVGILPVAGTGTYRNNMVRLGIDAAGNSIMTGYQIYGMFQVAGLSNIYFNSVYVGGTNVSDAQPTFAFVSNVTSGARQYIDNIFWNARSNGAGTGKHYAIALSGPGFTSNYNDLYASGDGGFVGLFGGADRPTLADWQMATGQDADSKSVDPLFVNPNGPAAAVDLHIMPNSPMVGMGTSIAGTTNDFDNQNRNGSTPDIGADEVTNFTGGSLVITKTADAGTVTFGSQIGFTVKLTNQISGAATGVVVTDPLPSGSGINWTIDPANTDPGWMITGTPPNQNLVYNNSTVPGNAMTQAHVVSSTTQAQCGQTITNQACFTTGNSSGSGCAMASVAVIGTSTPLFAENFDGVTPPALPAGWTSTVAVGPTPSWQTSNTGTPTPVADSAPNSARVDNPAVASDKRLDSPSIAISDPTQLTFRNNYNLESGFDGGVLEISTDGGGTFTDIIAAGGSFVTGGYNGTASGTGNPLAGRAAWTGNSAGFITTTVNLPASVVGQNVILRWRMGSDASTSGAGWRIDTVSIIEFVCPPPPAPALASAESRLTHGSAGTFAVPLPVSGPTVGVEPRLGTGVGAARDYTIVLTFDQMVNGGTASFTGTGTVSSVSFSGNDMIVSLTGVTDQQRGTLTVQNVTTPQGGTLPSASVQIGFLVGDVTGDGFVNTGDTIIVRNNSGGTASTSNARSDVNTDGFINTGDAIIVRNRAGNSLP